jgi:hypothetical protein
VDELEVRRRGRQLLTALAVLQVGGPAGRELGAVAAIRAWLGTWAGIGQIVVGMARQGYDLQLTRYGDEGWRATFYPAGQAHSVVTGTAWEPTTWEAVQGAAWETFRRQGGLEGPI